MSQPLNVSRGPWASATVDLHMYVDHPPQTPRAHLADPPRQLMHPLPHPPQLQEKENRINHEMEALRFETHLAERRLKGLQVRVQ